MVLEVSLVADQAGLFRMLEVVAMTLAYLPVDCLLDPHDLINKPIKLEHG